MYWCNMIFVCAQCGYSTDVKCNYIKHLNRKSKCVSTIDTQYDIQTITETSYRMIDETHVQCNQCLKELTKSNFARHLKTCKGVPKNTCMYCKRLFNTPSVLCRHKKTCKMNPVNMPPPPPPPQPEPSSEQYNVQNNYINNNTNNQNNLNVTNNFNFNFGEENVKYILDHEDPRYASASKSLKDTVDLVHFNENHPENQTVRKLNKKSDLMEFRTKTASGEDRWEQHDCSTGIPRLRSNLETKLNTKFEDDEAISNPTLKELLYHKSKRGNVPEEDILMNYNDLEQVNQRRCKEACDMIIQNFLKNTLVNIQKTPCVVRCLQQDINETRRTYGQPELTLGEVARSY